MIKKIAIKVTLNLMMLIFIGFVVVLLTNIPLDLNFGRVGGKLVSNMNYTLYRADIIASVKNLASGDYLGQMVYGKGKTVGALMSTAFSRSMIIFFGALILAVFFGVIKGIFDTKRGNKHSSFKLFQTLIPLSVPDVLTISLIQLFGLYLYKRQVSILGIGPIMHIGYAHWTHTIYPTIALALVPAAYIARVTSSSIESVYDQDYILTARGKGCSEMRIILNHTMKNAIVDLIAAFPTIASIMFSSLFIVERIFYYPGIAFEMLELYRNPAKDGSTTIAYMAIAVTLVMIYYTLYTILEITKQVLIPKLKN